MDFPEVESTFEDLQKRDIISRIWRKDHTVWKASPGEISNRLGWLDCIDQMRREAPALETFAGEIRQAGFRHVVLLGMGGASLGAEVLRQTFGSAPGYPELIVLDSTVPEAIGAVTKAIDPVKTLFIVASKSGSTIETLSLYKYFRNLAPGVNFIAITDPGTPLVKLAGEAGFRRTFLNSPDIGGRYSILSYFGLVPAALIGLDITKLLSRADVMRESCGAGLSENAGAQLGAIIGGFALQGRDKLTLLTSREFAGFGLWLEQLIAESTGKEGKGIVPIMGEPLSGLKYYGNDRLFVYLGSKGQKNRVPKALESLGAAGHPVIGLELDEQYDLGGAFFHWEFATAVAGAVLGVNPFDQPDVEKAKKATDTVLKEYQRSGRLSRPEATLSFKELLKETKPGSYLAIMAYLPQSNEIYRVFTEIRQTVLMKYRIATTLGYGPRYLHSTGQLHKGGPDSGLFLQITADHKDDLPIRGDTYSFGVLADAQALGDLRTLQSLGRRVCRIHLRDAKELSKIADSI